MGALRQELRDFGSFYRGYAQTSVHAVTTALLTAFGLLSFVHRGFVILAVAAYVVPPIFLYLTRDQPVGSERADRSAGGERGDEAADTERVRTDRADETGRTERAAGDSPAGSGRSPPDERGKAAAPEATAAAGTESVRGTGGDADADADADADTDADGDADVDAAAGVGAADRDAGADADADADFDADSDADSDGDSDADAGSDGDSNADGDSDADSDADSGGAAPEWTTADPPTDAALYAASAAGGDPYAVGDGGVVLARGDGEWAAVVEDGPGGDGSTLRGVGATSDGAAVWYAGDGGALGRYDVDRGGHADHSAPGDRTSTWTDVAVDGPAGEETLLLVNGSGVVLRGWYESGSVRWGEALKPGSGSSMAAATFDEAGRGYLCDTNGTVYATDGEEYEAIGVESGVAFASVAAAAGTVDAATTEGSIFRYEDGVWTRQRVHEGPLRGIDRAGASGLACGDGGGLYRLDDGWAAERSLVGDALYDVAAGGTVALAVGESGTILERPRR